ncbi:hypothetical protein, partial [Corynebacterium glyciniphilum]|uniref:hypothetical protein n=1 Tax=Corynebacterium glyciniphilum TaxID=1404244 RepID=UPI001C92F802
CSVVVVWLVNRGGELWKRWGEVIAGGRVVGEEDDRVRGLGGEDESWWGGVGWGGKGGEGKKKGRVEG